MEYEFAPASPWVTAITALIAAFLLALATLFGWLAWSAAKLSLEATDDRLTLHAPLYGRSIPRASLQLDEAKTVTLDANSPVRPVLRTNGIGLPGYGVGWFQLRNGERALVAMTTRDRALYLPTTQGFVLLLTPRDPALVLSHLRGSAGS